MSDLPFGLFDQVLNSFLERELERLDRSKVDVELEALDPADSHATFSEYLRHVLRIALAVPPEDGRVRRQVEVCNQIIGFLETVAGEGVAENFVSKTAGRLLSIRKLMSGQRCWERPDTPLSFGCLLAGTRLDPSLVSQLRKEIQTANRVDILCSFIKWSGIRILEEALRALTAQADAQLRVITTSYLGATDLKAVEFLRSLPNTGVRVSYDTHRTRLHAKAYLIHRDTGFGSAYIGSANISHAALTDGLEWNVKVSQYESPHLWDRVGATFEHYWNDAEFTPYAAADRPRLAAALSEERAGLETEERPVFFDLHPYGFQQEILDRLNAERKIQERNRHLIVAATGTGKTMIAAFDYRNWSRDIGGAASIKPRLLFVAHREELLRQSLYTYRNVLRDPNFGELLVGGRTPEGYDHLFVSIQSYNSRDLVEAFAPDHFDYIVIDEFHHAAAPSYERLLAHIRPRILLGLTATPERSDGLDALRHFHNHMSAQIRLPDAINRKLLCPFQYFGVTDPVSLRGLQWQRGGYRVDELDKVYTGNDLRAALVVDKVREILLDPMQARGLGFCVSVAHANYMAGQFQRNGIPAASLSSESDQKLRDSVQGQLKPREINFLFVVDLYNEGVDIPEVDTVLFLRPTESLTIFLQQLGRGLRLFRDKDCLTVLDFIGQAHRNFRFDLRYRALLVDSGLSIAQQLENGFAHLPAGCTIQMERIARRYVLENIRQNLLQSRVALARELALFRQSLDHTPSLGEFLEHHDLEPEDIYRRDTYWSRLCVEAGIRPDFTDPQAKELTRGLRRLEHISSPEQIRFLLSLLERNSPAADIPELDDRNERFVLMMDLCLWGKDNLPASAAESLARLGSNPALRAELAELLRYRLGCLDEVPPHIELPFSCPLALHALYTRDEILAGLGDWKRTKQKEMREGVRHLRELRADVFLITLNKTEREFSPTTMYQDYAINEHLFHWQSQSTTSAESSTGKRYTQHQELGHTILLFAREDKKTNGLAAPFYFLGPARYVSHVGSMPMSVTWRLDHPLPAKLMRRMARLAVG
jgi:superfamily II DNA or RNA helicase/HKD family nuclease